MPKHLTLFFILALLVGGCAPAPASPSPTLPPMTAFAPTITPTLTPFPTPSLTPIPPTATPYPELQTQGPYFLFTNHGQDFTIMDADGRGQKQFQLPDQGNIGGAELEQAVTPDGKRIAYFTGSTAEPYDLAIHVFDLSDGTSQFIANLIAPGYPENLRPVAKSLILSDYSSECPNLGCLTILTSYIFELGIHSLAWSPDGQYLAFAAQIDGPSSDIYLYDMKTRTVRRLTREIENILRIEWSPTGDKILYDASVPGPVDPYVYWYMADPGIKSPQRSQINAGADYYYQTRLGWITENSYLYAIDTVYYEPMGPGPTFTSVRYINVETNEIKEIWPYAAEGIDREPTMNKVILWTAGKEASQPEAGRYLVSLDGSFTKMPESKYSVIEYLEPFDTFLATDKNGQIYGVSPGGEVKIPGERPHISPDKKWFLIWESDQKLDLYSNNFQLIGSWEFDDMNKGGSLWRPDSLGVILRRNTHYYYLSIPAGEPKLVFINQGGSSFYTWIP